MSYRCVTYGPMTIKAVGIIDPPTVVPMEDGRYKITTGERRFRAAKQALRESPTYLEATRTGSIMRDTPAEWYTRKPGIAQNIKCRNASRRMDWLFRGALEDRFDSDIMSPYHVSAIDDFISYIDETIPSMPYVTDENRRVLETRRQFGRKILAISIKECQHYSARQAVGSHWFRNFVVQHGWTMEEVVYSNPFYFLTDEARTFHSKMQSFWEKTPYFEG